MANENELEDIEIKNELSILSYPQKQKPNYKNFLIVKNNFWHQGVHIDSASPVVAIYDAQIIAYRFIKNYKHRVFDIENTKFPENSLVNYFGRTKYEDFNKLFIKDEYGYYKLKKNASDSDKEKAYKLLNRLYSNSFILLEHKIKNCEDNSIVFYSLYNHLKPFARMTLEQKISLSFYFCKTEFKINKIPYSAYCKFFDINEQKNILLPSELPITNDSNTKKYIQWTVNNQKYEALIDSKYVRSNFKDGHSEIKRPGNDKTNNLTKKTDYKESKNVIILYNTPNKSDRLVKYWLSFSGYDTRPGLFDISISDLTSWLNDQNLEGLGVTYDNKKVYFYPTNKKEIHEAYNKINFEKFYRETTKPIEIFCSLEIGRNLKISLFNGRDYYYLKNKNNSNIYLEYSSNYIPLDKVYQVQNNTSKTVTSEFSLIPCETKVTIEKMYSVEFDGKEYHGRIDNKYIDTSNMKIKKAPNMYESSASNWTWKNDDILVYNSNDINNRIVIDKINQTNLIKLVNTRDLLNYKIKEDNLSQLDKGVNVKYKKYYNSLDKWINNELSGYIYFPWQISRIEKEIIDDKKKFVTDINNWLSTVEEEKTDIISKNFNSFTFILSKNISFSVDDKIHTAIQNDPYKRYDLKKDDIIGYTGYSIADEDDKTKNSNEDATSLHFEIFTSDNDFMSKYLTNKNPEQNKAPCYCKVNSECKVYQGEIFTICDSITSKLILQNQKENSKTSSFFSKPIKSLTENIIQPAIQYLAKNIFNIDINFSKPEEFSKYENICYVEVQKGFLTEGQYFSILKPIAKIIPMNDDEYFRKTEIEWNGDYYAAKDNFNGKEVQLYNINNEEIEGRKIKIYSCLRYIESDHKSKDEEDLANNKNIKIIGNGEFDILDENQKLLDGEKSQLRRPAFYLEKITSLDELIYIKTSDLSDIPYRDGKDSHRHYFFYNGQKLDKTKIVSKPTDTCWNTLEDAKVTYKEVTLTKDVTKKYEFCYEFMHEYTDLLNHKNPKQTWCKIKDKNTEYWVNKKDFNFNSKDGDKIGIVYYDKWNNFFNEINLNNYGKFKLDVDKKQQFINELKLNKLGITKIEEIPTNSSKIKNICFKQESEWTNNNDLTNEYIKLSEIQKKEITEYRKDLAILTDEVIAKVPKIKKENYFFNPISFLNHLDKVAGTDEFNPYIINGEFYHCRPRLNQNLGTDPEYYFKTNLGFATAITKPDGYKFLEQLKYTINGKEYFFATLNCPYKYSFAYNEYKNGVKQPHTGIDLPGFSDNFPNAPIISFINGTVWGIKWEKSYGNVLLIKDNHNFLYLLAHLEKINVIEDEKITPGKIVAFAGSTGSGGGNNPNNVHLHLEIFNINNQKKLNILGKENESLWNSSFDRWAARRNPLDNTEI